MPGASSVVWHLSLDRIEPVTIPTRGKGERPSDTNPFIELVKWIKTDPAIKAFEGQAIVVEPK